MLSGATPATACPDCEAGRRARTVFHRRKVWLDTDPPVSLLEAELRTGRTHQIRVHAAHAGLQGLFQRLQEAAGDQAPEVVRRRGAPEALAGARARGRERLGDAADLPTAKTGAAVRARPAVGARERRPGGPA